MGPALAEARSGEHRQLAEPKADHSLEKWENLQRLRRRNHRRRFFYGCAAAALFPLAVGSLLLLYGERAVSTKAQQGVLGLLIAAAVVGIPVFLRKAYDSHVDYQKKREDIDNAERALKQGSERQPFLLAQVKNLQRRIATEKIVQTCVTVLFLSCLLFAVAWIAYGSYFHVVLEQKNLGSPLGLPTVACSPEDMRFRCVSGYYGVGIGVFLLIWSALVSIWWQAMRQRIVELAERRLEAEIRAEFSASGQDGGNPDRLRDSQRLLKFNEFELGKYYRLNLRQNVLVFALGIFSMLIGFVIIAITLFVVSGTSADGDQLVTAIFGGVGALLSNIIAAIFLQMHAKSSEAMTKFHSRLADSNELFLANVLVAGIDDETKRNDAYAELATSIGGRTASP